MRKIMILTVFASLVACSTLPTPKPGYGIVALSVDWNKESRDRWFIEYRLNFGENVFRIRPTKELHYISLPTGFYSSAQYRAIYIESGHTGTNVPIDANVEVRDGEIVFFPWQMVVTRTEDSQGVSFKELPRSTYNKIVQEIEDQDVDGSFKIGFYPN